MELTADRAERKRAYMRGWKMRNRERHSALNRKSEQKRKREAPEKHIVKWAKVRARHRGIEFTITAADVTIPEHCPYLGIRLQFGEKGRPRFCSPSLDRIDPSKGYVPGNVRVISYMANAMKSNASAEQLVTFAIAVLKLHRAP